MSESNEQHDAEVESARVAAEKDAQDSGEDIIRCFDGQLLYTYFLLFNILFSLFFHVKYSFFFLLLQITA